MTFMVRVDDYHSIPHAMVATVAKDGRNWV
jgi:hypothetical protein